MLRILIYGLNYPPEITGVGKYTGEMAAFLSKRGCAVRVITSHPYYPAWKVNPGHKHWRYSRESWPTDEKSIEVFRCPLWVPSPPTSLKRVLHLLSFAVSSFPVCLSQVFWKPDLVFCIAPTILTAPAALTTAFLSKAGSWLHIQDFEFEAARSIGYFNGKSFLWRIIRNGITGLKKKFDRISTISETMLGRLKAEGLPPEKLFLFPNWVDLSLIRYSEKTNGYRKEMNITSGDVVVLFSGSMTRKQSLHTVVDAARMLIRHKNIHFVLCGEGASRHEIEEQAYSLSNIHFLRLQPVEKLNHLMNMADIHLLPQAAAAADLVMPSKAAAILASGRPMIATVGKDTAIGKLVQNAGLIIPPEDPAAMAEAIEYLAANRDIRSEMGRRARMIAEDSFSASAIFANFFHSLEDFISVKG